MTIACKTLVVEPQLIFGGGAKIGEPMDLDEYQDAANRTDQKPGTQEEALAFPLLGLASEVGSLLNQYKKRVRDGEAHELFSARVADELGDVLWYVSNLSKKLGFNLNDIAARNLKRTRERWPSQGEREPARLLDEDFPEEEQLPRQTSVYFLDAVESNRPRVRIYCDGRELGDPLSDMAWDEDAYRFHDAFHLTYAALLGWSPIVRTMFDRKRHSNDRYREIEDSGRAKVIEEAIAALVFEYASDERFLDGVQHIDFSVLETIVGLAARYEVRIRTTSEWERAIVRSFDMWRALRDHGGGTLHLDLHARSIDFEAPSA